MKKHQAIVHIPSLIKKQKTPTLRKKRKEKRRKLPLHAASRKMEMEILPPHHTTTARTCRLQHYSDVGILIPNPRFS
jgi:hypothetical protein